MYTEVTSDLFCIAQQLKQINEDYRVFWNNRDERFEVFTPPTLAFVVPFERLDQRTLDYARKTRKQNADLIEQEIAAHNADIENQAKRTLEQARIRLEDMLDYASKTSHPVTFSKRSLML